MNYDLQEHKWDILIYKLSEWDDYVIYTMVWEKESAEKHISELCKNLTLPRLKDIIEFEKRLNEKLIK